MVAPVKKYLELYHTLAKGCDGNYAGNSTVAIEWKQRNVRFRGLSGLWLEMPRCLLLAQSGHHAAEFNVRFWG